MFLSTDVISIVTWFVLLVIRHYKWLGPNLSANRMLQSIKLPFPLNTSTFHLLDHFIWSRTQFLSLSLTHTHNLCDLCGWPDRSIWTTWDMQGDWDRDGTFSSQCGHGPLCLCFVARGFDPGATQVGKLVKLHTVFLLGCGAGWYQAWLCEQTKSWYCLSWTVFLGVSVYHTGAFRERETDETKTQLRI